jgi:hypothetical protein
LSKIIERVVVRQLHDYLETESESLFVPVQSAYRPFHSTETALLKVCNDLLVSADEKDVATVVAFLDQSAAFDLVDHQILIARISAKFGICGPTLAWFQSYLWDRRKSVSVSGQFGPMVFLNGLFSVLSCISYTPPRSMKYLPAMVSLIISMPMMTRNMYHFGSPKMVLISGELFLLYLPA